MDDSSRLARMEAKLDAMMAYIEKMDTTQEKHNDFFYATRDKVNDLESRNRGAWLVIGIFSAMVSFLVSLFKG